MQRFPSLRAMVSAQNPNDPCLEFFRSNEKAVLSYGEVLERLDGYPLPEEHTVGILASSSLDTVLALLSIIGHKRVVLLNPDDAVSTLTLQVEAAHVDALIGDDPELIDSLKPYLYHGEHGEDNDVLFFTSGTTSKAKAVVLTESSLCSAAYNGGSLLPLRKDDALLCCLPLSHVFGFVCSLLWPLSFGAKVCLGRGIKSLFFDFDAFRPTVVSLVPQMAGFLAAKKLFNPELDLILIGAGDCSDDVLNLIKSLGIRIAFGYGLTETSSGVALSLGDNPRLMSVCPDYGVELAEDGEILVYSPNTMMKGYYLDPEKTAEVLVDDYLHTGDLGKLVEGKLCITGRKKEILVFDDGSKVFLPEYEQELAQFIGPDGDFAAMQRKNGTVALYIYRPQHVEEAVNAFNQTVPMSHRVASIVYARAPLPRTKTNKVQRYLIPPIE